MVNVDASKAAPAIPGIKASCVKLPFDMNLRKCLDTFPEFSLHIWRAQVWPQKCPEHSGEGMQDLMYKHSVFVTAHWPFSPEALESHCHSKLTSSCLAPLFHYICIFPILCLSSGRNVIITPCSLHPDVDYPVLYSAQVRQQHSAQGPMKAGTRVWSPRATPLSCSTRGRWCSCLRSSGWLKTWMRKCTFLFWLESTLNTKTANFPSKYW